MYFNVDVRGWLFKSERVCVLLFSETFVIDSNMWLRLPLSLRKRNKRQGLLLQMFEQNVVSGQTKKQRIPYFVPTEEWEIIFL